MSVTNYTVGFELADGRILECKYSITSYPATRDEPAESEASEPVYYLEGREVPEKGLPKGLSVIAELMYEDPDNEKFGVTESYGRLRFDD